MKKLSKEEENFIYIHDELSRMVDNLTDIMNKAEPFIDDNHELFDIYLSLGYAVQDVFYIQNCFTSKFGIPSAKEDMMNETFTQWDRMISTMNNVEEEHKTYRTLQKKKD